MPVWVNFHTWMPVGWIAMVQTRWVDETVDRDFIVRNCRICKGVAGRCQYAGVGRQSRLDASQLDRCGITVLDREVVFRGLFGGDVCMPVNLVELPTW